MEQSYKTLIQTYNLLLDVPEEKFQEAADYVLNHQWSSESVKDSMLKIVSLAKEKRATRQCA